MSDFDAPKLMIVGLAEIELPSRTLRFCDGGFVYKDGNKFTSADEEFGSIERVDTIEDRTGDEAPGGRLTFLPVSTAAAADLSDPAFQDSPLRFWVARVDEATGELAGTPDLVFDGELDTTTLRVGLRTRALDMEFSCVADRLFNANEGNVLSDAFHKSVWPGEEGLANAGMAVTVPWGAESPPRAAAAVGSGGGAVGGGGLAGGFMGRAAFNV